MLLPLALRGTGENVSLEAHGAAVGADGVVDAGGLAVEERLARERPLVHGRQSRSAAWQRRL